MRWRLLFFMSLSTAALAAPPSGGFARPYTPLIQNIIKGCQGSSVYADNIDSLRTYLRARSQEARETVVVLFDAQQCAAETYGDFLPFKEKLAAEVARLGGARARLNQEPSGCIQTLAAAAALVDNLCGGVSSGVHVKVLAVDNVSAMAGDYPGCAGQAVCTWAEKGRENGDKLQYLLSHFARHKADAQFRLQPIRIIGAGPSGGVVPEGYDPPARAPASPAAPAESSRQRAGFLRLLGPAMIPIHNPF